ncbi:hypothetical protein A9Q96_05510 [Rhodobacterales bacterium 52_120_T64]|nr:hypothetical protein A9Q96_05510 [Rhodobacterales bacterium 52_120_T64]
MVNINYGGVGQFDEQIGFVGSILKPFSNHFEIDFSRLENYGTLPVKWPFVVLACIRGVSFCNFRS